MTSTRTSVSIPKEEELLLEKATDRIFKVSGYPAVTNSEVFRIGLRAILRMDRETLTQCVDECPYQSPGRKAGKKRDQMTAGEIEELFKL